MAINGKFVKIERVMEKVRRDLPGNYELSLFDAIEMIGEAIPMIGTYAAYVNKVTDGNRELLHPEPVVLENYRAKIPCDLYKFNSVRFISGTDATTGAITQSVPMISSSDVNHMNINRVQYSENDLRYKINNGYIYVSGVASGSLLISYEAFATDERGFPLIPDDERYVKALGAYLQERIGFRLMMQDKLTERKYSYLEQNWMFAVNSAYTGALLQTIDDAEEFRNSYTRMITDSSAHSTGYRLESNRQEFNIHN